MDTDQSQLPQDVRDALQTILRETLFIMQRRVCCINCMHFNEERELCTLYNAQPPARTIALGCAAYKYNGTPF